MIKTFFQKYSKETLFLNAPLIINTVIALITLPIILANLPIIDYGKWQFVLALQVWFLAFSATNITLASKRGIARGFNGTFFYAFWGRYKLIALISVFVVGLSLYFRFTGDIVFFLLLLILAGYLLFGSLFQASFFEFLIAKKRFKQWSFWQVLITSFSIIASTLAAYLTQSIVYFAVLQLGSTASLSFLAWYLIVKKEGLVASYKKGEIDKECVSYGLKLIPVDLVSITAGRIPHFIIGPVFGFANLAVFSVANQLRDKTAALIKSVRSLLYADFARLERKKLTKIINQYLVRLGLLGALLVLGLIGAGWAYIALFLPQAFHQAILYFTILVLGLPAGLLAVVLHTLLESHLRYKELAVIGIAANSVKIISILIFGYFWQIVGVCVAIAISGWLSFAFYYFLTLKSRAVLKFVHSHPFLGKLAKKY